MTKLVFKNHYSQIGRKKDFGIKYEAEDMTDQSQIVGASITEMAKKFGIDAIMARAEQLNVDDKLKDQLYGHDYTQMFNSREELLNVKKKLNNVFENIPARIRKETFNDDPMEFINAYTSNDETKLEKLKEIGLVSNTQFNQVKEINNNRRITEAENLKRKEFISKLNETQGELYENFKKTGNIAFNVGKNDTVNNSSVQTDLQ